MKNECKSKLNLKYHIATHWENGLVQVEAGIQRSMMWELLQDDGKYILTVPKCQSTHHETCLKL